ncbi:MAG: hypothetical protein MJZ74_02785 [Muribaculaceae bacterium]|nr:hypothetical protein [Muribaculaceae bacterium]
MMLMFPYGARLSIIGNRQAAAVYDALAWRFNTLRPYRPLDVYDVEQSGCTRINDRCVLSWNVEQQV